MHLVAGGMSWPILNQTVCALRFLYGVTLKQADLPERIPYAREPGKLPVVIGVEEVVRFLEAAANPQDRIALITAYATGLRAPRRRALGSPTSTAAGWSSVSSTARAARTAMSCCRRNCSASCAPIGAWHDRRPGCFPG